MIVPPADDPAAPRRREFGFFDYFKLVIPGAALALFWTAMHSLILPLRVLQEVGDAQKNSYLGYLTFSGLFIAMLVQPLIGVVSDRCRFGWGRRRPFILIGGLLAVLFIPGVALAQSYLILLAVYCLLQIVGNVAQGPAQALIPDLVARRRRGLASGIKGLTETLVTVAFLPLISFFLIEPYSASGNVFRLWLALAALGLIILASTSFTVATVKEECIEEPAPGSTRSALLNTFRIDLRRNPNFPWFLGSRLLMLMAIGTILTFALYFARDYVKVPNPEGLVWQVTVVVAASILITSYPAGRLSDRLGRKRVVIAAGLGAALAFALMFWATSAAHMLLAAALLGLSMGAFMSSNWALATDLVPPGEEGRYLGLTNLATAGASALSRLIGPAIDFFNGLSAGTGYQFMLGMCIIYLLAGSLLVLKVREHPLGGRVA